eukprot:scaffold120144_cov35-Attheya_sp.AAC.1
MGFFSSSVRILPVWGLLTMVWCLLGVTRAFTMPAPRSLPSLSTSTSTTRAVVHNTHATTRATAMRLWDAPPGNNDGDND